MKNYLKTKSKVLGILRRNRITSTQAEGNSAYRISRKDLSTMIAESLCREEPQSLGKKCQLCGNIMENYKQKFCSDQCQTLNQKNKWKK